MATPDGSGGSTSSLAQYAASLGVDLTQAPAGMANSTAPTEGSQRIFVGWDKPPKFLSHAATESNLPGPHRAPNFKTLDDLVAEFERKSVAEQHRIAAQLAIAGYAGSVDLKDVGEWVQSASYGQVLQTYKDFLNDVAGRTAVGQSISPDDLLKSSIAFRFKAAGVKWDGKLSSLDSDSLNDTLKNAGIVTDLSGTHSTTNTSKSVNYLDPQDAKALTRGMLQQELGRDPTSAEYEDFLSMLHAAQHNNPDVTKTTQTYTTDADGNVVDQSTNSVTNQGIGAAGLQQMAQDHAQQNPDWAEWQAMGTYFPALLQALGSTVPGT